MMVGAVNEAWASRYLAPYRLDGRRQERLAHGAPHAHPFERDPELLGLAR